MPTMSAKSIGAAVKAERKRRGLTQKEAAALAGISEPTWRVIERGQQESFAEKTVSGIQRAFRWPANWSELADRGDEIPPADVREEAFMAGVLDAMRTEISELARSLSMSSLLYVAALEVWLHWWELLGDKETVPEFDEVADYLVDLPAFDEYNEAAKLSVGRAVALRRREQLRSVAETGDAEGARGAEPRKPAPPEEQS